MPRPALPMTRFTAALAALTLVAAAATGCATLGAVDSEVASFGAWPADLAPGTYAFERLPSQAAQAERQAALENAARPALEKAGFRPVAEGATPAVIVQIGARIDRTDRSPWDDPFWWHGPGLYYPVAVWPGPWHYGWPWRPWPPVDTTRYEREVALLLRDAATGKPLYEAHASNGGVTQGNDRLLQAMFEASLAEFPKSNEKAHSVRILPAAQ